MAQRHSASALLLLLIASFALPSCAQTPGPEANEEKEVVCLTIATHWVGSPQDTKTIQSKPVPDSFQWRRNVGGCDYSPPPSDLVLWHLSFGTEASALAAADVIAGRTLPSLSQSNVRAALLKDWRPALRNYQTAEKQLASNPEDKKLQRAVENHKWQLIGVAYGTASAYHTLAGYYLEIADVFASQRALAQTERFLALEADARAFVTEDLAKGAEPIVQQVRKIVLGDMYLFPPEAPYRLRAAVLRARILQTPEAIDAAVRQVDADYRPEFREAWREISGVPDPKICSGRSEPLPQVLSDACSTHNNLEEEVAEFLLAAAQLELVIAGRPDIYVRRKPATFDTLIQFERRRPDAPHDEQQWLNLATLTYHAIRYAESQWRDTDGRDLRWRLEFHEQRILTLILVHADAYAHAATLQPDRYFEGIEEKLLEAERRARSDLAPTRMRQIAERYLWAHQAELAAAENPESRAWIASSRTAAYFRHVLEDLDAIAVGE